MEVPYENFDVNRIIASLLNIRGNLNPPNRVDYDAAKVVLDIGPFIDGYQVFNISFSVALDGLASQVILLIDPVAGFITGELVGGREYRLFALTQQVTYDAAGATADNSGVRLLTGLQMNDLISTGADPIRDEFCDVQTGVLVYKWNFPQGARYASTTVSDHIYTPQGPGFDGYIPNGIKIVKLSIERSLAVGAPALWPVNTLWNGFATILIRSKGPITWR
jgi:hypothetical protein